jgi:hypothetical protein
MRIDWQEYLHVEFSGVSENEGVSSENGVMSGSCDVGIQIRTYRVGVGFGGNKVWQDLTRRCNGGAINEGEPDVGYPDWYGYTEHHRVSAMVPRTPENEAALREIVEGFRTLSKRLVSLLSPEEIQGTLSNLAGRELIGLSGTVEKPKRKRQ